MTEPTLTEAEILALERPESNLLYYYAALSILLGPLFFVLLIPLYFRYKTLRYSFDNEGVSMRWGVLFHREINLTYTRIQDIHLVSNVVERWLGLARIKIQTASGSAKAEMTIEGIGEFQALRDFLYERMRGARQGSKTRDEDAPKHSATIDPSSAAELTATLQAVAAELRGLRQALAGRQPEHANPQPAPAPREAGDV